MTPPLPAIIQDTDRDFPGFTTLLAAELAHNVIARRAPRDLAQAFLDKLTDDTEPFAYLLEGATTIPLALIASDVIDQCWDGDKELADNGVIALHALARVAEEPGLHAALMYFFNIDDMAMRNYDRLYRDLAVAWTAASLPAIPLPYALDDLTTDHYTYQPMNENHVRYVARCISCEVRAHGGQWDDETEAVFVEGFNRRFRKGDKANRPKPLN